MTAVDSTESLSVDVIPSQPVGAMRRFFYDATSNAFAAANSKTILGTLIDSSLFDVDRLQVDAWTASIAHLKIIAEAFPTAHIFLEFTIPRMGKRVDAIVLLNGLVFVLEYKVGKTIYSRHDIDQTMGYALDLKNFHESSHNALVIPILIATEAPALPESISFSDDGVATIILANKTNTVDILGALALRYSTKPMDAGTWSAGRYKPTPTIIEAAQALYRGHDVKEISRNEAGADNLSMTSAYIEQVAVDSEKNSRKSICFVTGVPGSGKTLAGLNIAVSRMRARNEDHAVFLSGNGPLVDVLREALTIDAMQQAAHQAPPRPSKPAQYQKASAVIQNIHHFRDENLSSFAPPVDKVVVFDEAQRAWDVAQTSKFMKAKRGQVGFSMSEPEFLLSVMDRHDDWCVIVCLIGGGQEINTGEAGISEWLNALESKFPHWNVHLSDQISNTNYVGAVKGESFIQREQVHVNARLHLAVSLRSFRAEYLSNFIGAIIDSDIAGARELQQRLKDYPIVLTRSLTTARKWLRERARGGERIGLLASSNALRLKPEGVFMKSKIEPKKWFLAPSDDVRSSNALEDAGSEFDVQGLELDWACVCWDANLRRRNNTWEGMEFSGSKWQKINGESRQAYLLNSYRVLLTRARQGLVIFVPEGDKDDLTRTPSVYGAIHDFLISTGIEII